MACIGKQKTASGIRRYIQLSPGENESRPKISLGKVTKKQAETAKRNIESLIQCKNTGDVLSLAVQEWLGGIADGLRKRLNILGIAAQDKGQSFTVAEWIGQYIERRPDVKQSTRKKWRDAEGKLAAFFRGQYINEITVQLAKDYRVYLKSTVGLAENSIRWHIGIARQFFNSAIDAEFIKDNPFCGKQQPVMLRENLARIYYIKPETALQVLEACPDCQWRLIFGLARYGGLRCPSEILRLKWQDVDFEHDRFTVHASKTEHHADAGIRTVPMFPELRPLFQDAFDNAQDGDVYCITRYRPGDNLSVHMRRIVKQAGLEPWPKIFQNMRSTRETELFKLTNGNVKAVCSWIGNSPEVAMKHYAQVTEADIQDAARMAVIKDGEVVCQGKRVHNTVQTTAAPSRTNHKTNLL
jgi:integrase